MLDIRAYSKVYARVNKLRRWRGRGKNREPALNDLTTLKGTSVRRAEPDGIDPLIREAAADGRATHFCRAAFNPILDGERATVSELAKSTGASSHDVQLRVGRAWIIDE